MTLTLVRAKRFSANSEIFSEYVLRMWSRLWMIVMLMSS